MKIKEIKAYEILASGGFPTVECNITLDSGVEGIASVPYGASAGSHEATVLEDGDLDRYYGNGMLKAVENVNKYIAPVLLGQNADDQFEIDRSMLEIDGTENKSKLGGNAILAVSLAVARAAANERKVPLYRHISEVFDTGSDYSVLPRPMVVAIEGGKHADNSTDLQEFCITGISDVSAAENIRMCLESYHQLEKVLENVSLSTNVGNEGAFAPEGIASNEAPFGYILEAIDKAGYKAGTDLGISIDAAASEYYTMESYKLKLENKSYTSKEISAFYEEWLKKYPLITIEDMHHEDDWDEWVSFKQTCDKYNVTLVGDDLTVTNPKRLQKAIDLNAISAILIKLNQIGSLSETVQTCMLAKKHNMMTIPSHRGGGESNDDFMVDLAVAVGSKFIKVGPTRGERVSKYNRLMAIERELKG
jgi:enolase